MTARRSHTKKQHYVWRHYLDAWTEGNKLWCYRQKARQFLNTKPKEIGSETYFYQMHRLTAGDKAYLAHFIDRATDPRLRKLNHDYVALTQLSFEAQDRLLQSNLPAGDKARYEQEVRIAAKTIGENYHSRIEGRATSYLKSLREMDISFYENSKHAADFIYFLCNQYFRTNKIRRALSGVARPFQDHDPGRTASVEQHIAATNVSSSLVAERKDYRIVLLPNDSSVPIITGDQPVINMLGTQTNDIEFYYPISPRLSMIFLRDRQKFTSPLQSLSTFEVEHYNHSIYEKSEDQIYGSDECYLRALVAIGKSLAIDR